MSENNAKYSHYASGCCAFPRAHALSIAATMSPFDRRSHMDLGSVAALVVIILLAGYAVQAYNGLVRLKHGVGKAWSNIDVLLRQRHEELPKLVETCRQYMQHERNTLEAVVAARGAVAS